MTFRRTTCKHCLRKLNPERPSQLIHPECAAAYVVAEREKEVRAEAKRVRMQAKVERAETRRRKEAIRPISKLEDECRSIVQKIARIRDRNDGCISCELPANWDGQWHGSHFRSHGACSALQFHLWNIHKACWICNKLYSGRINQYEPRLVQKMGQEKVDWLKTQDGVVKPSREYLYRFKKVMGKRLRRMEKKAA